MFKNPFFHQWLYEQLLTLQTFFPDHETMFNPWVTTDNDTIYYLRP